MNEDLKDRKDKDKTTSYCSDQEVVAFPTLNEDPKDREDKDKAVTGTTNGHRSATSTGCGTAPAGAEPQTEGQARKDDAIQGDAARIPRKEPGTAF